MCSVLHGVIIPMSQHCTFQGSTGIIFADSMLSGPCSTRRWAPSCPLLSLGSQWLQADTQRQLLSCIVRCTAMKPCTQASRISFLLSTCRPRSTGLSDARLLGSSLLFHRLDLNLKFPGKPAWAKYFLFFIVSSAINLGAATCQQATILGSFRFA